MNLPSKSRGTEYKTLRGASTNSTQATGEELLFKNRIASTAACLTTIPAHATEVPRQLFPSLAALLLGARATHAHPLHPAALAFVSYGIVLVRVRVLLGAHDPHLKNLIGSRIGDRNLTVDANGGALGVAVFPGDRWCRSRDLQTLVFCGTADRATAEEPAFSMSPGWLLAVDGAQRVQ